MPARNFSDVENGFSPVDGKDTGTRIHMQELYILRMRNRAGGHPGAYSGRAGNGAACTFLRFPDACSKKIPVWMLLQHHAIQVQRKIRKIVTFFRKKVLRNPS